MIRAMVDIDNTICRTNEMLIDRLEGFHENIYPYPLPEMFFEQNPEIFRDAQPYQGAAEKLKQLVDSGNFVAYVTARKPWAKVITEHWLKKNDFPPSIVVFTNDKRKVAINYGLSMCIEDAPHELDRLIDLIPALVPATQYNQHYENRFSDWNKIDLLTFNKDPFLEVL